MCDGRCTAHFERADESSGQGTEEERHADEERRLAHVAATRAKDWLVFTHVDCMGSGRTVSSHEASSFQEALTSSASRAFKHTDLRSSKQKKQAAALAEGAASGKEGRFGQYLHGR